MHVLNIFSSASVNFNLILSSSCQLIKKDKHRKIPMDVTTVINNRGRDSKRYKWIQKRPQCRNELMKTNDWNHFIKCSMIIPTCTHQIQENILSQNFGNPWIIPSNFFLSVDFFWLVGLCFSGGEEAVINSGWFF